MDKEDILRRLKNDNDYYGDFGKKFLSNSDIKTLLHLIVWESYLSHLYFKYTGSSLIGSHK